MSKRTWDRTWGGLVPQLQGKVPNKTQNKILDQKILHKISQIIAMGGDVNDHSPIVQCTILHLCVGKGLIQSVKLLLKNGADKKATNLFHETPAQYVSYAPFHRSELDKLFHPVSKIQMN